MVCLTPNRLLFLAGLLAAAWGCAATAGASEGTQLSAAQGEQNRSELLREMRERRKAIVDRRARGGIRAFVDDRGVPTFTNRLEKYRHNSDYIEVVLEYEPIQVAPKYQGFTSPIQYSKSDIELLVEENAARYGVDKYLIHAMIRVESNGNPHAVSRAGARGLMQLMPSTAAQMGVTDIHDPAQNIAGGTQYLSKLLGYFKGDFTLALAGYNAGPGTVNKYNGVPPFKETQAYIRDVNDYWQRYKRRGGKPDYLYGAPKYDPAVASASLAKAKAAEAPAAPPEPPTPAPEPAAPSEPPHAPSVTTIAQNNDVVDTDEFLYVKHNGLTRRIRKPAEDSREPADGAADAEIPVTVDGATPPAVPGKTYTVHLNSGWSHPAQKVIDADDYYYVEYNGVTTRIRKEHVKEITGPA